MTPEDWETLAACCESEALLLGHIERRGVRTPVQQATVARLRALCLENAEKVRQAAAKAAGEKS